MHLSYGPGLQVQVLYLNLKPAAWAAAFRVTVQLEWQMCTDGHTTIILKYSTRREIAWASSLSLSLPLRSVAAGCGAVGCGPVRFGRVRCGAVYAGSILNSLLYCSTVVL
jgi:hypothetical protein